MGSTRRKRGRNGAEYAPLLGQRVHCATLQVVLLEGRRQVPALDSEGRRIVLPRDAELADLEALVDEPGRYRVIARDPESNRQVGHRDHNVEPAPAHPRRTPVHMQRPVPTTPFAASAEHAYLAHLHETINNLRDQMREMATRADRDIRYERERADAGIKAAQEKCEAVTKQAFDANVKLSAYVARLEARDQRVDDLEAQLAEMKAEVDNARELAAELKLNSEDAAFDPLNAFMQMDQALDIAAKTARRFQGE